MCKCMRISKNHIIIGLGKQRFEGRKQQTKNTNKEFRFILDKARKSMAVSYQKTGTEGLFYSPFLYSIA